ncbi:MAG: DNA mismatch repair endonuclease MutL [Clostridia bacterium]|nr:DNA mismatch repair endonuclease MutL [Clostridia bacterium]
MPKINVLPKSVAELIAAGEVVERPSSAVKELIENSIDAGATAISVEIKNGGVKYIRVTDNGCGIHREDVRTAFISHATSKISSGEDLDAIFTLGFRGEALPSIAAVSRLSMLTKTEEEEIGTLIDIEGGEEKSFDDAGCPDGTTIIIRDLFYNTPARMKFLKKDMTEGSYVSDIVAKTAISHPEIRFSLIKDGKQVISTPGNSDLKEAIFAVFGKDISEALIPCEYEYKSISVKGYISRPLNNRPNRNLQYCYVNGRFVRIPVAAAALDEAYKNRIMVGKFPMCFLFVDIPAGKIDVNVHPAKTEIRFSEDSSIFEAIFYAAKSALNKGDTLRPEVSLRDKKDITAKKTPEITQMRFSEKIPTKEDKPITVKPEEKKEEKEQVTVASKPTAVPSVSVTPTPVTFRDTSNVFSNMTPKQIVEEKKTPAPSVAVTSNNKAIDIVFDDEEEKTKENTCVNTEINDIRIVGEIFKTYILVEQKSKLLIIDKHAAHERMIFNKLSENGFSSDSQLLLSPISVTLSGKEYAVVLENLDIFSKGGFLVEDFGGGTVIVRECPVTLQKEDISAIISEMAGELLKGNMKPVPEKLTWLYHSTACRAAVKAGDELKPVETEAFVKQLLSDDSIRYCPHGRPVMYELTKHEIEKQFGRI